MYLKKNTDKMLRGARGIQYINSCYKCNLFIVNIFKFVVLKINITNLEIIEKIVIAYSYQIRFFQLKLRCINTWKTFVNTVDDFSHPTTFRYCPITYHRRIFYKMYFFSNVVSPYIFCNIFIVLIISNVTLIYNS